MNSDILLASVKDPMQYTNSEKNGDPSLIKVDNN